ncbi:hypothetical protein KY285_008148 [Solanum tuberosum]|nr:hypothetical protein KY285_008148 [Solanum tuberosum]
MVGNMNHSRGGKQSQKLASPSQGIGNPHPRINHPQHPQKFQRPNLKFKGKGAQYNPNVSCTYCGKTGHVEDNYFRLIGFLDDFQFTNDKCFHGQIRGNRAMTMGDIEGRNSQFADQGKNTHFADHGRILTM